MQKQLFILTILILSFNLISNPVEISGSRDQTLQADVQIPKSDTPLPCLIIAPGKGYHKDLPITQKLAEKSTEKGFVSIKFNWDYHTKNIQPEQGYENEFQDLQDLIAYAKTLPEVDKSRIYLIGKSLGSFLAYNVFVSDSTLAGVILLTPIIPDQELGNRLYPELKTSTRNIAFLLGDKDYDNCPLKQLYTFIQDAEADLPVMVVGGDHGLNIGSYKKEKYNEINQQNIETAVDIAVNRLLIWDFPNNKE